MGDIRIEPNGLSLTVGTVFRQQEGFDNLPAY